MKNMKKNKKPQKFTKAKNPKAKHSVLSQRQLRVGELVRQVLTDVLAKHDNLLLQKIVSVVEVRMSPDLKIATCFVVPESCAVPLQKHAKLLRHNMIGSLRSMRYLPLLKFLPDSSFSYSARIDELLHNEVVRRDINSANESIENGA